MDLTDIPTVQQLYERLNYVNNTLLPGETHKERIEWIPLTKIEDWLWLGGCHLHDDDPFYFFHRYAGQDADVVISIMDEDTYYYKSPADSKQHVFVRFRDHKNVNAKSHFTYMAECIEQYRRQNKKIFVHCVMGISRSATTLIHYFNRFRKMNIVDAYIHVRSKRNVINPNDGFLRQLC